MGAFFNLFKKKKKHEGINEFSIPDKKGKNKSKKVNRSTSVEDELTPKTAATVKPVVVNPEKSAEEPTVVSQPSVAEVKKEDSPMAKATTKKEAPKAEKPAAKETPKSEKTAVKAEPKKAAAPKAENPAVKEAAKSEKTAVKAEPKKAVAPKAEKPAVKEAPKAAPEVSAENDTKNARTGRFEIKKAKDGRFVFNLYAPNHVIVATSQVYSSSTAAVNGIKSIINNAEKAPLEDNTLKNPTEQPFPKWEMYIDKGGQFRFRLFASNGSCVVHSQGYTAKNSCKKGIESIIKCAKDAEIDKSYLKKDDK